MRPAFNHSLAACGFVLLAVLGPASSPRPASAAAVPVDTLLKRAATRISLGTHEGRRQALDLLEEATVTDPQRYDAWLALGQACIDRGHFERGRNCLERAAKLSPESGAAQAALGSAWKWDWLHSLDRAALVHAEQCLARAVMLDPAPLEPWLDLAAVELVRGNPKAAGVAALRARRVDPESGEPWLALACAAYRLGALGRADSAFGTAIERLPAPLASRFTDVRWLTRSKADSADAGWSEPDPDLTTPENEAELDFRARLGIALLLFRDARGQHWDYRTELFVRFGPPGSIELNPPDSPLLRQYLSPYIARERTTQRALVGNPEFGYAFNVQAWRYPDLGMRVDLWDQSLAQAFELPALDQRDPEPKPNPALVAARSDLVALPGGRGVFRRLPPNTQPMEIRAGIARFPAEGGTRLVAHVETAGGPADTLTGSWAVADEAGRVLRRGNGPMGISSCDPGGRRVIELSAPVGPGEYRIDFAAADARGRRGLARAAIVVPPPAGPLVLSDVLVLCGPPPVVTGDGAIRLQPDLDRRSRGGAPLTLYFEITGLAAASGSAPSFAYRYVVRPVSATEAGERAGEPVLDATREESHAGGVRRQFVQVPVRSLRPGGYRVDIEVRDLASGNSVSGAARFTRE